MHIIHRFAIAAPLMLLASGAPLAQAQPGLIPVVIGSFTTERQCTLYAVTSGSERMSAHSGSAGYAGWGGAGYASSMAFSYARAWRTELVRDCVSNFTALRQSMEAAIASSGKFRVVRAGTPGAYTLTGAMSEVGAGGSGVSTADLDQRRIDARISVQFSLKDSRGRAIHGNMITKSIEIASVTEGASSSAVTSETGRTIYTRLQREVAFAVARSAAFKLVPLRVDEVTERRVRLNYGTPLIARGAVVLLEGPGGESIKCTVNLAGDGYAWAETRGTGDIGGVEPGSTAIYAEADSDEANSPTFERVDLPF